jgi:hypothetical protein
MSSWAGALIELVLVGGVVMGFGAWQLRALAKARETSAARAARHGVDGDGDPRA